MDTTSETIPVQGQESNAPTPTKGWSEWFTDKVSSVTSSVTGSSDTKASLEAEKAELNTKDRQITIKIAAIDEKIRTLPAAPPGDIAAAQVEPINGGRRRTRRSTKRNRRSKKTKRRRSKRSGKRTRR